MPQQQKLVDELKAKIKVYQEQEAILNEQLKLQRNVEKEALKKTGCIEGPSFTFLSNEIIK